jgi:Zn-dependent protease
MTDDALRLPARREIASTPCGGCGTQLAPSLLACPACGTLTHVDELNALAASAEEAERSGALAKAAGFWRSALALLPAAAPQRPAIVARVDDLTRRIDAAPLRPATRPGGAAGRSAAGAIGAMLLVLLTKGKLLVLGLAKAGTLLSMFAFLSVYVKLYGWALAGGIVLSIYGHEMGHVVAMVRYGMQASAPMFVPGFGAFVRSSHTAATPREDAVIGLAGPIWGFGAALVSYCVYLATGAGVWGAIAHVGAMLNLLNLSPVWQLDGARAFSAMSRPQRWTVTALLALGALVSGQRKLWLVVLVGAYAAYQTKDGTAGDRRTVATFLLLAAALTWLMAAASVAGAPL